VSKGYITELKVVFTPMGTNIACKVQPSLCGEDGADAIIPIGDAKARIIAAGLWTPKGQEKGGKTKKADLLPLKTLVSRDFDEKDPEKFKARVLAVAKALGDQTARGRIGSLKLMAEGVDTFEKWWSVASCSDKSRLLSDAKQHKTFTRENHAAVAAAFSECPFRGPVPTPAPEEDDAEKEKPPTPSPGRRGSPKQV